MANWEAYRSEVLKPVIASCDATLARADASEDIWRQSAADVLKAYTTARKAYTAGGPDSTVVLFREAAAILQTKYGLLLLQTNKSSEGERAICEGIKNLTVDGTKHISLLLDAYNGIGRLAGEQGDLEKGKENLRAADQLYRDWQSNCPIGSDSISAQLETSDEQDKVKEKYAQTLWILAQVHDRMGDARVSAEYRAGTLELQLGMGLQNRLDWADNCNQLANYFISSHEIAVAEHVLACAIAARELGLENPSAQRDRGSQIAADLSLTWAKLCLVRLLLSVKAKSSPLAYTPQWTSLPSFVRFTGLKLAGLQERHWDGGFARNDVEAVALFNTGICHLKKCLTFYDLAGHVVMHCNIVLLMSEMHRWLADFQVDKHRQCVLHKIRGKRIKSLLDELRQHHATALVRPLQLDAGSAYREIADIKYEDGRAHDKVASAASQAHEFYRQYVDSFRTADGRLPESLDNADEQVVYIHGVFYLARAYNRMDPPITSGNYKQTENLREAVVCYRYCASFIRRNSLVGQESLARTCLEMADLITENAEMLRIRAERAVK